MVLYGGVWRNVPILSVRRSIVTYQTCIKFDDCTIVIQLLCLRLSLDVYYFSCADIGLRNMNSLLAVVSIISKSNLIIGPDQT